MKVRVSKLIIYATVGKFTRDTEKKPAVPKKDEKPIFGLVSDKNFIVANAVENILAGKILINFGSYISFVQLSQSAKTLNNF